MENSNSSDKILSYLDKIGCDIQFSKLSLETQDIIREVIGFIGNLIL